MAQQVRDEHSRVNDLRTALAQHSVPQRRERVALTTLLQLALQHGDLARLHRETFVVNKCANQAINFIVTCLSLCVEALDDVAHDLLGGLVVFIVALDDLQRNCLVRHRLAHLLQNTHCT